MGLVLYINQKINQFTVNARIEKMNHLTINTTNITFFYYWLVNNLPVKVMVYSHLTMGRLVLTQFRKGITTNRIHTQIESCWYLPNSVRESQQMKHENLKEFVGTYPIP